ncbi:MAG: addiction module protein [Candidatus Sumerlaeaceae bacterium]
MSTSADLSRIKAAALQLSVDEKIELAEDLYLSANGFSPDGLDPEQRMELERRLAEVRAGTAKLVPWEQLRDEILEGTEPLV